MSDRLTECLVHAPGTRYQVRGKILTASEGLETADCEGTHRHRQIAFVSDVSNELTDCIGQSSS
jgi:hypothetical protein